MYARYDLLKFIMLIFIATSAIP